MLKHQNICIIVAMDEQSVIGRNNDIPWNIPTDMKRFKELTTDETVIMGKNTFLSIGQALPNRENIVVSSTLKSNQAKVVSSVHEAIELARTPNVFLIGGRGIYEEGLALANIFYLTVVHGKYAGDVLFPEWNENEWEVAENSTITDAKSDTPLSFLTLVKYQEDEQSSSK